MGANITVDKFEKWMQKNYWSIKRTNKHVTWIFEPCNDQGKIITYTIMTMNHHRTKGQGIGQGTLLRVAKVMKIPKNDLVELMRENKEYEVPETMYIIKPNRHHKKNYNRASSTNKNNN